MKANQHRFIHATPLDIETRFRLAAFLPSAEGWSAGRKKAVADSCVRQSDPFRENHRSRPLQGGAQNTMMQQIKLFDDSLRYLLKQYYY
jgi:hypothetical protein